MYCYFRDGFQIIRPCTELHKLDIEQTLIEGLVGPEVSYTVLLPMNDVMPNVL